MTFIDNITAAVGKFASWLTLVLVLVIVVDVILRYTLSVTSAASFEIEWHLFAAIFLLGAAWTLQEDKHVRVDVFYQRFSEKTQAWVNLLGSLLFLMPFCIVGFWEAIPFVKSAFLLSETSPQPGGLPARWVIKSTIPAGLLLLGLQAMSLMIRQIKIIRS